LIDLPQKTLRRRARELFGAAAEVTDLDSRALLLFYAAECGLKAIYMARNVLKTTSAAHAARSAASFNHRLDEIIVALKIPAATLAHQPGALSLRAPASTTVAVGELNQVWRYGATLAAPNIAVPWLEAVVTYALKELR
jgi:hypothetical protein